jgi:hypothetical protein
MLDTRGIADVESSFLQLWRHRMRLLCTTIALFLLVTAPGTLRAQRATLQGRIVQEDGRAVASATIEYAGSRSLSTPDGTFTLTNVPLGTLQLTITALGFAPVVSSFTISRDTTITIVMRPDPIRMQTLQARLNSIKVKGRVTDERSRLGVDASIRVFSAGTRYDAVTNATGRYEVDDVLVGDSAVVVLEAFGYLPQRAFVSSPRDTTINFVAVDDPVARALVDRQLARLTARSAVLPYKVETGRVENLNQSGTLEEALRVQHDLNNARCVILDDKLQVPPALRGEKPRWRFLTLDQVHSFEIIDRGHGSAYRVAEMLRIYTKQYVRRMVADSVPLDPIQVFRGGLPALCR